MDKVIFDDLDETTFELFVTRSGQLDTGDLGKIMNELANMEIDGTTWRDYIVQQGELVEEKFGVLLDARHRDMYFPLLKAGYELFLKLESTQKKWGALMAKKNFEEAFCALRDVRWHEGYFEMVEELRLPLGGRQESLSGSDID